MSPFWQGFTAAALVAALAIAAAYARLRRRVRSELSSGAGEQTMVGLSAGTAGQIAALLSRLEALMDVPQLVADLVREVSETRGAVDSAVVYIQGLPKLIEQAVADALAANPGADLSGLVGLKEALDAQQSDLIAALTAAPHKPEAPPSDFPVPPVDLPPAPE